MSTHESVEQASTTARAATDLAIGDVVGVAKRRSGGAAARRDLRRHAFTAIALFPIRAAIRALRRLRDGLAPENFGVVADRSIYRSARLSARAVRSVHRRHGIRTIVDLAAGDESAGDPRRSAEIAAIRALGIRRIALHLRGDGQGNPRGYADALRAIADPALHPVLVHCAAGANRTSTVAVMYLAICRGIPLDAAMRTCRRHGCDFEKRTAHREYVIRHLPDVRRLLA